MASTGRVPLWLVALVGGMGVITLLGIFILHLYKIVYLIQNIPDKIILL